MGLEKMLEMVTNMAEYSTFSMMMRMRVEQRRWKKMIEEMMQAHAEANPGQEIEGVFQLRATAPDDDQQEGGGGGGVEITVLDGEDDAALVIEGKS
jgi:hypothetical protein